MRLIKNKALPCKQRAPPFGFRNKLRREYMQNQETMSYMMNDLTQYIMMPKIRYAEGVGTYVSYDIAEYDCFKRDIIAIVWDVTSDRDLALQMCGIILIK